MKYHHISSFLRSCGEPEMAEAVEELTSQHDELLAAEHDLSDAYLRLREKLKAFDTPPAPTPAQVYSHTEAKLDHLLTQRDGLLEALRDLELGANTVVGCYDRNPGNFAAALADVKRYANQARAAIATGSAS